jgi:hypothetical protein
MTGCHYSNSLMDMTLCITGLNHLKQQGNYIIGYVPIVIMPNHFHALIAFSEKQYTRINTIVGNGKAFYGV